MCVYVCTCVRVCVCMFLARVCRAVELLTSDSRRPFKLSSNLLCSVIWPAASVADTVKTRAGFAKTGLD